MPAIDTSNWIPGTRYFTQITEHDHSGWLYIITLISLAYMLLVFVVRFVVRYGMYGNDDWALLAATALGLGQHIAVLAGIGHGIGKSLALLSPEQLRRIEKYMAAHIFLFFFAHCASKFSTALLMQRLFSGNGRKRNVYLCRFLLGASGTYGIWAILSFVSACPDPAYPLSFPDRCPNRELRWDLLAALDITTEVALSVVPIVLIFDVKIKRDAKILAEVVFASRLLNIVFIIFTLENIHKAYYALDFGLALVPPFIWSQTELLWSVLAASVPCVKTVMRPFDSMDEQTWRSNNDIYTSGRSHRSWIDPRDGAVPLKALRGNKREMVITSSGKALGNEPHVRPDRVGHDVVITHHRLDKTSDGENRRSWGSQERIIKAQTHWEVTHESPSSGPYALR